MVIVTVINITPLYTYTNLNTYIQSYVINITFALAKPEAAYCYDEDNY